MHYFRSLKNLVATHNAFPQYADNTHQLAFCMYIDEVMNYIAGRFYDAGYLDEIENHLYVIDVIGYRKKIILKLHDRLARGESFNHTTLTPLFWAITQHIDDLNFHLKIRKIVYPTLDIERHGL